MWERLRSPGGSLGSLSLISAVTLGVLGALGFLALLVGLVTGADFWSDEPRDTVIGMVFFALTALGSVGFLLMDRSPWGGAALAVLGGLALALALFWAVVPIVLGLGAGAVALLRAWAMSHGGAAARSA